MIKKTSQFFVKKKKKPLNVHARKSRIRMYEAINIHLDLHDWNINYRRMMEQHQSYGLWDNTKRVIKPRYVVKIYKP